MDAEYILIRAVEPTSAFDGLAVMADPVAIEHRRKTGRPRAPAYLDRLAERLRARGLQVQTQVVVGKAAPP